MVLTSTKSEVHNLAALLEKVWTTVNNLLNVLGKFDEVQPCDLWEYMLTDRQTDTLHYFAPLPGWSNKEGTRGVDPYGTGGMPPIFMKGGRPS